MHQEERATLRAKLRQKVVDADMRLEVVRATSADAATQTTADLVPDQSAQLPPPTASTQAPQDGSTTAASEPVDQRSTAAGPVLAEPSTPTGAGIGAAGRLQAPSPSSRLAGAAFAGSRSACKSTFCITTSHGDTGLLRVSRHVASKCPQFGCRGKLHQTDERVLQL